MTAAVATATLWGRERAPRRHNEEQLHRAVWRYLQWALPSDACAYHPANGGKRHPKAAARMAALGVVPGVPDLAIVWRGQAIFVELKAPTGYAGLSLAQRDMHRVLICCGAQVVTCRSLECVETSLRELGVPLRGSVLAAGTPRPDKENASGWSAGASMGERDGETSQPPAADSRHPDARRQGEDYPAVGSVASPSPLGSPLPLEPAP